MLKKKKSGKRKRLKNIHRLIGSKYKGVIYFPIAPRYSCLKLDICEEQVWINMWKCVLHTYVYILFHECELPVYLQ